MAVNPTVTPAQATATSGTTLTISSVAPTGTGRIIMAAYSLSGASSVISASSIKKNTTDFDSTALWSANDGSFNSGGSGYMLDPSTASEDIILTTSGATDSAVFGVTVFDGVDTGGTPLGTPSSATGSNTDPAGIAISTSSDDYVFGAVASNITVTFSYQGGGTEQDNDATTFAQGALAYENNASSANVEWGNGLAQSCWLVMGGVNLNAGSGGGGRTTKNTDAWNHGVNVGMGFRMAA